MTKLGARNYALIKSAVKIAGTFDPKEIAYIFEESLYIHEYEDVFAFLAWVHENGKTFGSGNYEEVFAEWKKSLKQ